MRTLLEDHLFPLNSENRDEKEGERGWREGGDREESYYFMFYMLIYPLYLLNPFHTYNIINLIKLIVIITQYYYYILASISFFVTTKLFKSIKSPFFSILNH